LRLGYTDSALFDFVPTRQIEFACMPKIRLKIKTIKASFKNKPCVIFFRKNLTKKVKSELKEENTGEYLSLINSIQDNLAIVNNAIERETNFHFANDQDP
jgi:hypothetical protein